MLTLTEVREKIAESDARIKAERNLRGMWTACLRALEAEEAMSDPRKEEDDENHSRRDDS